MRVLVRPVTWRNPYRLEGMSLLFHLHRAAFAASQRLRLRLLRYPLFKAFPAAYRLGLPGGVRLALRARGKDVVIELRTRNLQFSSLYMPQHAGGYEPETSALLDALVAPDGVFYDVGSNWGYYALWLAGRDGFHGKIHAFEPEPASLDDLRSAVAQAGLGGVVTCHGLGVSDRGGVGAITIPDGMHGGCATLSSGWGREVRLARLDDLGFEPPGVIKLDVEGHEARAFGGASRIIEKHRPHVVFESWARADRPEETLGPLGIMEGHGYRFFHPAWAVRSGGGTTFLPSAALQEGARLELSLVPFAAEQRFLLREQLNVFACHEGRLAELERIFPG